MPRSKTKVQTVAVSLVNGHNNEEEVKVTSTTKNAKEDVESTKKTRGRGKKAEAVDAKEVAVKPSKSRSTKIKDQDSLLKEETKPKEVIKGRGGRRNVNKEKEVDVAEVPQAKKSKTNTEKPKEVKSEEQNGVDNESKKNEEVKVVKTKGRKKKEPTPVPEIAPEKPTKEKKANSKTKVISETEMTDKKDNSSSAKRKGGRKAAATDKNTKEELPKIEEDIETTESQKKKVKETVSQTVPEKKKKASRSKKVANGDEPTEEEEDEPAKVAPPESKSRSRKRAAPAEESTTANEANDEEAPPKTKAKKTTPLNATQTAYSKSDFDLSGKEFNFKISSWNVAGMRSWLKKDGLKFLDFEEPDIFCMQETKCTPEQLPEEAARVQGYHPYWLCKPGGYAGVGIYSKIMPINVEYGIGNAEFDEDGRIITAEYEKFFLINVYVPNSGRKLVNLEPRMKWEKLFQAYVKKLDALKPVIICGDMNVSHEEIDLANPKSNTRNAGFTKEEREKMSELLDLGYVDTFRHLYPGRKGAYTFWTYMGNARSRNIGWRLDYFIASERLLSKVVENAIRSQVMGSDHCPITLFLNI